MFEAVRGGNKKPLESSTPRRPHTRPCIALALKALNFSKASGEET